MDKLEALLVYTRFHGISKLSNARKRLDVLCVGLGNASVASPSYEDLLTLCHNTYCGTREMLLMSTVRTHMDILREHSGLVGMTRLALVFFPIRLCTVKTALYLDFFGDPDKRQYPRKKAKEALSQLDKDEKDAGKEKEGEEGNKGQRSPRSSQFK